MRLRLCQETTLVDRIAERRLNWFRRVSRMGSERLPAKALHCSYINGKKKPRKTTEEMDGQCKWRYRSEEVDCTTSNGSGVGQKQMETSSSSLIIIEMMEENRRRETRQKKGRARHIMRRPIRTAAERASLSLCLIDTKSYPVSTLAANAVFLFCSARIFSSTVSLHTNLTTTQRCIHQFNCKH